MLLIDLDYQASATSMALRDNIKNRAGQDCRATRLVDGQYRPKDLVDENWAPSVSKDGMVEVANFRLISSDYDLSRAENRLMVEWLLGETSKDIRYTLAKLLHDPETQANFDRIIIDAPPRLTTACVQALCAATHVIVPTVLDRLSAEAVETFVDQIRVLKDKGICPNIELGAVIGYRSGNASGHVADVEELIFRTLKEAELSIDLYRSSETVRHYPILAESAGEKIAYLRSDKPAQITEIRQVYAQLAKSLEDRISDHAC